MMNLKCPSEHETTETVASEVNQKQLCKTEFCRKKTQFPPIWVLSHKFA